MMRVHPTSAHILVKTLSFLGIGLLVLLPDNAHSQKVTNSTGNTIHDNLATVEYSIGEISITTITANGNSGFGTQGLLQPAIKVPNPACITVNDTINCFPNPTRNILSVVTPVDWIQAYRIYAVDGKLIRIASFVNNQIDMSGLPGGAYFIKLYPGCDDKFRILKVIKQQ